MDGYAGKILRVDLTNRKITEEPLNPKMARDYIGGTGLGNRIIYDEVPPSTDPLSPESKIVFATGPVTGTNYPSGARYQICFKSPLTGILCDASSGGYWGADLKRSGYDALIIEGASEEPVYIWIRNQKAEIRPATHLWGQDALKVQESIQREIGDERIRVACIGPAGEKRVLLSCIINDEGRAPGRGGNGAILGSKNLKAIAVRGNGNFPIHDLEKYNSLCKKIAKDNGTSPAVAAMREYGTAQVLDNLWAMGDIPVKNWQLGIWEEGCKNLGGKKMKDTILVPHTACYRCTIGCSRWVKIEEGPYKMDGPGPEYETLAAMGTMCLIDNLNAVSFANDLCNRYGIDTISTGVAVAFAMEAYEKGLIKKEDTGGIDLKWGDDQAMIAMVHQIGKREKLGAVLGQGVKRAAEKLGGDSWKYAVHVKGMESPMHDPRTFYSMGLTYAVGPRGACHLHGHSPLYEGVQDPVPEWGLKGTYPNFVSEGKGNLVKVCQDYTAVVNSMVSCYFLTFILKPSDLAEVLTSATGTKYTAKSLLKVGERIMALHRAYNNLCGITRKDDVLAPRQLEATKEGGNAGKVPDMEVMLKEFYKASGWTPSGKPSRKTLESLGLSDVARDLYGAKKK
ncbi:MAG TPA: aldehyde ferredoxin oxidoreductase family protein [Thermodesulfobacteriota bacterium]|nr:aldehyde ferredoxin oxidoreductase family protein [Thermodesulfobacteriota bacterium]